MSPETVDLLIRGALILTMDKERRRFTGDLVIQGDRILALGPRLDFQAAKTIDASHHVALPGLINAHTHETLTRGLAEDLPLDRWLAEICFPLDMAYTADIMRAAAMMNQLEMIRGGTTCFLDIYRYPAACAEIAELSGLRAILAPQIISDPPAVGETIEEAEAFVVAWKGRNPRIRPALGPHAPYSCPPEVYRRAGELACTHDVSLHTHLSETRWEVETILSRYGRTPTEHLESVSFLSPRLSVAHGVHLSTKEIDLLAARGVSVVYNPTSNMKLASGVAPIVSLRAAGVTVALGTDSNLSNNNLDMFEEMRLGAVLQKLDQGDASALGCEDVLAMATIEGARALGLADQIGSLEPGKQADVILVNMDQPHLWPLRTGRLENTVQQLVYSANAADVTHTIVAGQLLMEDRRVLTLDLAEARRNVTEAAKELLARAGVEAKELVR